MKTQKTNRGFALSSFLDDNGYECSLQESSANGAKIWLGVKDANKTAEIMAKDAHLMGIETRIKCGWINCPIPKEVLLHDRMHLSQKQVKQLIPALQHFVDHGCLPE